MMKTVLLFAVFCIAIAKVEGNDQDTCTHLTTQQCCVGEQGTSGRCGLYLNAMDETLGCFTTPSYGAHAGIVNVVSDNKMIYTNTCPGTGVLANGAYTVEKLSDTWPDTLPITAKLNAQGKPVLVVTTPDKSYTYEFNAADNKYKDTKDNSYWFQLTTAQTPPSIKDQDEYEAPLKIQQATGGSPDMPHDPNFDGGASDPDPNQDGDDHQDGDDGDDQQDGDDEPVELKVCGDVKKLYKGNECCGNKTKPLSKTLVCGGGAAASGVNVTALNETISSLRSQLETCQGQLPTCYDHKTHDKCLNSGCLWDDDTQECGDMALVTEAMNRL